MKGTSDLTRARLSFFFLRGCLLLTILCTLGIRFTGVGEAAKDTKGPAPPLRVHIPFEAAWEGMLRVLKDRGWNLTRKNRGKGEIHTAAREYISGPLTKAHMDKIGERPRLSGAQWKRVHYGYEISVQLVSGVETLMTVDANISALKRGYLGEENWVRIPSTGRLEKNLLTQFGQFLFGQNFSLNKSKKGFWGWFPEIRGGRPAAIDTNRTNTE